MLSPLFLAALLLTGQVPQIDRVIWGLIVNDVVEDDVAVVMRDDGPWIPVEAIERLNLTSVPAGQRQRFGETEYIALSSLAPAIQFVLDEDTIQLRLTVATALLPRSDFVLSNQRPPGMVISRTQSLFFNYFGSWTSQQGGDIFGEFAANSGSLSFFTGSVFDNEQRFRRGMTTLTYDQPAARRRWSAGDQVGRASALGSAPVIAGVGIAREGLLDPYAVTYPTPSISGSAFQPSTARLYVDGQVVSEVRVPTGDFSLSRLPVASGLGRAQVVLTDASGRQQQLAVAFYLSTDVLRRGEQDYHYMAGVERNTTLESTSYGRKLATALHRVGVSDAVTLGFQAESDTDTVSGGPTVDVRFWRAGTIGFAAAASSAPGSSGQSASLSYEFVARRFAAQARATWVGEGYSNLYFPPLADSTVYVNGGVSATLSSRVSLALGYRTLNALAFLPEPLTPGVNRLGIPGLVPREALQNGVGDLRRELQFGGTVRLTSRMNLRGSGTRVQERGRHRWEGLAALDVTLTRRDALSVATSVVDDVRETGIEMNRSLTLGPSVGYRVNAVQREDVTTGRAELAARTTKGTAMVGATRDLDGGTTGIANLAGSVVFMNRRLGLLPVINDGFALVQVPGVRGVRVYANHQEVGRTGRSGHLFVSGLQAYLANTIAIDPEDVPFDVTLGLLERTVAPAARGGAFAQFEARRITAVIGRVVIVRDGADIVPAYGTLTVDGAIAISSPLNADGDFYLEDLAEGEYPATIEYRDERCTFTLSVPSSSELMLNLGRLTCSARN